MPKSFYITTTLPYVNADPHVGFALEIVQADVLARSKRLQGVEVFFNTGTDEHGQKILETAQKSNKDVKEYVDHFAGEFQKLKSALNLSNDTFVRTSNPEHYKAATEMWKLCDMAGDIYKKSYEGLYCVGCERFLTERDMKDGVCLIHSTKPVLLKEENYFFRFSKYQDKLIEYLSKPNVIIPEWRRNEAISFVKEGLEDFSISREKGRLSWGIPVPDDDTQIMYVWFDALTNYISTLGWPNDLKNFEKFWQEGYTLQTAGKDQVRFQSLMWQAMLFSSGIKNTDTVFYHGFINSGGVKMSKSLGNVINPLDLGKEYGTDAVRYYLLRHIHPFEDSDMTLEKFKDAYNSHLANGLGNLVSRIMKMASDNLESVPEIPEKSIPQEFFDYLETFEINKAADFIWAKISELDEFIQKNEPFKLVKTDKEAGVKIIGELVIKLYSIARMLNPILPETSTKIKALIKENKSPAEPLFARKD